MKTGSLRTLRNVKYRRPNRFVRKEMKRLLKEYKKQQVKIVTKIGIVYERANKEFVVLPYFDSSKKYQVWGVCVCNEGRQIMVSKNDFGTDLHVIHNDNWFYVLMLHSFIKGLKLPDVEEMEMVYKHKKAINDVMELFALHGLKADKLEGPYVIYDEKTSYDCDPENKMFVFHYNDECEKHLAQVGCFERCLTRLIK